jgi:hypothetical protein
MPQALVCVLGIYLHGTPCSGSFSVALSFSNHLRSCHVSELLAAAQSLLHLVMLHAAAQLLHPTAVGAAWTYADVC